MCRGHGLNLKYISSCIFTNFVCLCHSMSHSECVRGWSLFFPVSALAKSVINMQCSMIHVCLDHCLIFLRAPVMLDILATGKTASVSWQFAVCTLTLQMTVFEFRQSVGHAATMLSYPTIVLLDRIQILALVPAMRVSTGTGFNAHVSTELVFS